MNNPSEVAKVFMSGRSQAVRLPKSCRFETAEVWARRVGNSVILTPRQDDWAASVRALFAAFEDDAMPPRSDDWPQHARKPIR